MSYKDGWRVYEDIPVKTEKLNMLQGIKASLEKQLGKQQVIVSKVSEATRKLDMYNSTPRRRSAVNMKLSDECNFRDTLQRKIGIIEDWMKELI